MKYSPLSFKKDKILKIYPPIKGINNYDSTVESDPLEAVRLNNVIIENGCIKNRKGLNAEYKIKIPGTIPNSTPIYSPKDNALTAS